MISFTHAVRIASCTAALGFFAVGTDQLAAQAAPPSPADDAESRSRELGTITVIGRRPTSLPTQIPTTIEGITVDADRTHASMQRTAEDALKYFPSLLRAQALHRRLRPRRARDAGFGHRQQRPLARLRRRHPAVEPARQRRHVHAALGAR